MEHLPPNRLRDLARYGAAARAQAIGRMAPPRRLATLLAAYRPRGAEPADTIVPAGAFPNSLTFHRDLEAAGIARHDDQETVVDFHALRTTFVSWLAASGAHPRTAQALARHADVETTMQRYTDLRLLDTKAAGLCLPGSRAGAVGNVHAIRVRAA